MPSYAACTQGDSAWEPGLASHLHESPAKLISREVSPGTNKVRVSRALGNGKQTRFLLSSGQDAVAVAVARGPRIKECLNWRCFPLLKDG